MSFDPVLYSGRRFGGNMDRLLQLAEDLRDRSNAETAVSSQRTAIPQRIAPESSERIESIHAAKKVLSIPTASFPDRKPLPFEFRGYPLREEDPYPPLHTALPISRRRFGAQLRRLEIPALDLLYINVACRILQSYRQQTPILPLHEFLEFIQDRDEDSMVKLSWSLLMKMTNNRTEDSAISLLKGARRVFESRYFEMVQEVVRHGNQLVEPGLDMDESYLFRHFAACRYSRETSFNPHRGGLVNLPWRTVYDALRSGRYQAVSILANRLDFPMGFVEYSPQEFFSAWLNSGGMLPLPYMEAACALCSSMLEGLQYSPLSTDEIYMIMTLAFVSGQIQFVDVLMSRTGHTWDSIDEYIWFAICCVRSGEDEANLIGMLTLDGMQKRFNAFTEEYYTQHGQQGSTLYMMLLLCSLQFKKAIQYVLKMEDHNKWISHAVHLAIAMESAGILDKGGPDDAKLFSREEIAQLVEMYGMTFSQVDLQANWQYQFFATRLRSVGEVQNDEILFDSIIEVLSRHNSSQDTELSRSAKEALIAFEPNPAERELLYETLGGRIFEKEDFDLAFKCFLAANNIKEALHTINKQIASKLRDLPCQPLVNLNKHYFDTSTTQVALLLRKFATIHNRLQGHEIAHSQIRRTQKESFALHAVFTMMSELWKGQYITAMELFQKLEFLPKKEQEISASLNRLQQELPLVYSILDKVFGVFCRCCQSMEQKDNWRQIFEEQIIIYQRLLQVAAENDYSLTNQVSRDLAEALSKLQTN
eukprot:g6989.t1